MSRTIQNPISKGTRHYSIGDIYTFVDFIFILSNFGLLIEFTLAVLLEPFHLSSKRLLFWPPVCASSFIGNFRRYWPQRFQGSVEIDLHFPFNLFTLDSYDLPWVCPVASTACRGATSSGNTVTTPWARSLRLPYDVILAVTEERGVFRTPPEIMGSCEAYKCHQNMGRLKAA
jgi:hypothetical protein